MTPLTAASTRYHLKSSTARQIADEIGGDFVLISASEFQIDGGERRTRYTVRRPRGKKLLHLIGYDNSAIKAV